MQSFDSHQSRYDRQGARLDEQTGIGVFVDAPRGDWHEFHFYVNALQEGTNEIKVMEGFLDDATVRSLAGKDDGGINTCVSIYELLEDAAGDFEECTVFEDID